jgi:hypothetical protein
METLTFQVDGDDAAQNLASYLKSLGYRTSVPPQRLASRGGRVRVAVEEGQANEVRSLVSNFAPNAQPVF